MGFRTKDKDKKPITPNTPSAPGWKSPNRSRVTSNQNLMLNAFKAMAIDMKRRGKSDEDLKLFSQELTPQSLGLEPNPYTDHIFVQLIY